MKRTATVAARYLAVITFFEKIFGTTPSDGLIKYPSVRRTIVFTLVTTVLVSIIGPLLLSGVDAAGFGAITYFIPAFICNIFCDYFVFAKTRTLLHLSATNRRFFYSVIMLTLDIILYS